jgi:hypothetical protein
LSNNTIAKEISATLTAKYHVKWITPVLVQVFIVFSSPIRKMITAYIHQNIAVLETQLSLLRLQAAKSDTLAASIMALRGVIDTMLMPVNDLLKALPLDTIIKEMSDAGDFVQSNVTQVQTTAANVTPPSDANTPVTASSLTTLSPDLSSIMGDILSFIPLKIPAAVLGLGNSDFFQGINSFSDLQAKIDDLDFRIARTVALSTYANAGVAYVNNLLTKANIYIDIINTLDTSGV